MALSALFERVVTALFGGPETAAAQEERQLVADTIELVVDAVEPRIRLHSRYRQGLDSCVRNAIAYLRSIAREQLEPVLLARSAWSADPRVNAFFATADDVPQCLGRSTELRAFFEDAANRDLAEAYALLGMRKEERTVLAPRLEGDVVKQDVAQVTVCFSGHRVIAPAPTLAATRREIGGRIIQRLAQIALSRIVELGRKATELESRKASLGVRLRLLHLGHDGLEGVITDPAAAKAEIKALESELKQTADDYIEAKGNLATLDVYIEHIRDVFSHPEQHITLSHTPLRLDRSGFKVDAAATGPVNEIVLTELSIGPNLRGAIAIVHCPRGELPPKGVLLAEAERYL